eukprot:TRINITY_DN6151_c0_g2_i1.p1 TRINITY_DN6151_c0_g2~~TRINITY_DN6151_c0_g2_i1.p1  ORF type:complete len:340 (-),score=29.91 TRINITY_DN6151_c0_g2_i1:39-1058(-)
MSTMAQQPPDSEPTPFPTLLIELIDAYSDQNTKRELLCLSKPIYTHLSKITRRLKFIKLSESLQSIAYFENVKFLDLSFAFSNVDDAYIRVFSSMNAFQLVGLNLQDNTNISDGGMDVITRMCPNLTELNVVRCRKLTDTGIEVMVRNCQNLRSLDLCSQVTERGLSAIARCCPGLMHLSLRNCFSVPALTTGLDMITRQCTALRSLDLGSCWILSDSILELIARNCPMLETISLHGCNQITDIGIQLLIRGCTKIHGMDLSSCPVSDQGLFSIAQSCPEIEWINLSDTALISPEGLKAVAEQCKKMAYLDVSYYKGGSDLQSGIEAIKMQRPAVQLKI